MFDHLLHMYFCRTFFTKFCSILLLLFIPCLTYLYISSHNSCPYAALQTHLCCSTAPLLMDDTQCGHGRVGWLEMKTRQKGPLFCFCLCQRQILKLMIFKQGQYLFFSASIDRIKFLSFYVNFLTHIERFEEGHANSINSF